MSAQQEAEDTNTAQPNDINTNLPNSRVEIIQVNDLEHTFIPRNTVYN